MVCHTDNGPQFVSREYSRFSEEYEFKHTRSSPYYPKGNGKAEAAVKITESMLKKAPDFHNAMLLYRNTPPQGHTYLPAQRMFLRCTKTTLPTSEHLLTPTSINFQNVKDGILKKRKESKIYYNKTAGTEQKMLSIGNYAYAKTRSMQNGFMVKLSGKMTSDHTPSKLRKASQFEETDREYR